MIFDPISYRFSYNFVDDVAQTNGSINLWDNSLSFFRNKRNESLINIMGKKSSGVKISDHLVNIIFSPSLGGFVEGCI
jgi:hypothetical protein